MRKLLALVALAAVAACGGDASTSPISATVGGSYSLRTINGTAVPFIVAQVGADKVEITDDIVILNDGGTWTESGHTRTTQNGQVSTQSFVDAGTFTRTGTAITLVSSSTGSMSGSLNGGTLTVTDQGLVAVYQR